MDIRRATAFVLFYFLIVIANAQSGFDARWKSIDSLITKKGLMQSALAEVNTLSAIARQQKNEPQVIKALVYRLSLEQSRSDSGQLLSMRELEQQLITGGNSRVARSILQSILAGLYTDYLQANRYRIGGRTNTAGFVKTDVATWTLDDLARKITELHLSALADEDLLWQTSLTDYSPIVVKGNASHLRPTLFDLLAHTALDYFAVRDPRVNETGMERPGIFLDAAAFSQHRFMNPDTLSAHFQALLLFQRLIRRHLTDKTPDALMDVDLARIVFVHQYGIADNKRELYMQLLGRITDQYGNLPVAAQAWYLQAEEYANRASSVANPHDTLGNVKAVAICERVIAQKDTTDGWTHCHMLLGNLKRKSLTLTTEKVNIPNHPFRVLVDYHNFSRLYLRLIRVEPNIESRTQIYDSLFWKKLLAWPVLRAWSQDLPDTKDYLGHQVEIAVGSLPPGKYALIAGTDDHWRLNEATMGIQDFLVSRISFITRTDDYFVLDRETGQPLAGAKVQVLYRRNNDNGLPFSKGGSFLTDARGYVHVDRKKLPPYTGPLVEITIPGDHYYPPETSYADYYYPPEEGVSMAEDAQSYETRHTRGYLYTDRAIYRPGQTVFFKGIEVTEDAGSHKDKLVTGDTVKLLLLDANYQRVDSLALTTNAFGSYHGSFPLPENRRNGLFYVQQADGRGQVGFSVEEYKRPTFYVDYEKQKGVYRVGDSIRVTGFANGYAGNGIDGATVVYRVVRRANFPYAWLYRRRPMPVSQEELQHGEMRADGKGKFTITFYAAPDKSVSPDTKPEYNYAVSADVTDINGETHPAQTDVLAGYSVIRLGILLPNGDHRPADSVCRVAVSTTNLAGEPVSSPVHLALYPLQAPQRLIRARLWPAPDRYVLPEREFLDSFPHDEYREEGQKDNWEKGKLSWEQSILVSDSGKAVVTLTGGYLPAGWYQLEASSADKYGQTVVDKQIFELVDGKTGRPVNPQYVWGSEPEHIAQPGETVTTAIGTSASNVYVIRTVQRPNNDVYEPFTLNQERNKTSWMLTENDRGGFGVLHAFVKDNRVYTQYEAVSVPWTNKELAIHYASYRDKTEPGSKEQWRVKITGSRGEQASAEVLATMYDASLDQFEKHSWNTPFLFPLFIKHADWSATTMFGTARSVSWRYSYERPIISNVRYDRLFRVMAPLLLSSLSTDHFQHDMNPDIRIRGLASPTASGNSEEVVVIGYATQRKKDVSGFYSDKDLLKNVPSVEVAASAVSGAPPVQPRKDFRETAFFFPDLQTDSAGNVTFSFAMPEALTTWKWMTLAHTRDLAFGFAEKSVITQKELMVQPNAPRFLREGDRMELPVKVVNVTDTEMTGQVHLTLTDPTTGQTADGWFTNRQASQYFTVPAHQSVVVRFPLDIPYQYNRPLTYAVTAETRNYSDGEEATLPVVSNRMLVTESLPLNMPVDGTKHFNFDKLIKSGSSETLNHHALTVEFTTNPTWYAVQALPYLMEYPYECAEQTFNRAYANALATSIVTANPRLQEVFDRWRTADTAALLSNLEKNPGLKSILLEETPWVLQGKSEEQQKKNIALLFDLNRMSRELESTIGRLSSLQSPGGAFPWFKGGMDDRYITQYILTGIGHLQKLKAIPPSLSGRIKAMVAAALPWLDAKVKEDYRDLLVAEKQRAGKGVRPLFDGWLSPIDMQYLYMRSMFSDYGIPGDVLPAVTFYRKQAQKNWVQSGKYMQGMIALALFRTGDVQTAKDIIASLKQTALHDEEKGMYWKGMEPGYFWYQAPIEIQSLLIEAFREIGGNETSDRELKTWLLRQKQTHSWPTTKATADACYALLLGGQEWLNVERNVAISLGDKKIDWPAGSGEAGTGYHKQVFDGPFVNPAMGNITVKMETKGKGSPAWGAVYWQYFDMLDRITPTGQSKAALRIEKKLFVSRNTDHGPVLEAIPDNGSLKAGDKVVVRIVIVTDRDMEYVHMKDMRAACFEPVNVLSQYKWQDGLGYYESTKDASTDFFFGWLPKGTHVFEYTLFTGQAGNFSNGVTSIECMYAPEFAYHSEGIRVNVEAAP